jgi:signal transduction histidine kinase
MHEAYGLEYSSGQAPSGNYFAEAQEFRRHNLRVDQACSKDHDRRAGLSVMPDAVSMARRSIVTSSLENLEHENLSGDSARYTARAKDGAQRLKKILNAMSEANRVEELMQNADLVGFDLQDVLKATVAAYGDAWPERAFVFESDVDEAQCHGAPELVIQMLDKLVDNAVDFSKPGDSITIGLSRDAEGWLLSVRNPGPPLPDRMRTQLFDSMISVRSRGNDEHLGLGLYIARLIAEGHGGSIRADNTETGVVFEIRVPC